jgi:hypothetical protein
LDDETGAPNRPRKRRPRDQGRNLIEPETETTTLEAEATTPEPGTSSSLVAPGFRVSGVGVGTASPVSSGSVVPWAPVGSPGPGPLSRCPPLWPRLPSPAPLSRKACVRARGLEPPSLTGPGPKPGASASFATPAEPLMLVRELSTAIARRHLRPRTSLRIQAPAALPESSVARSGGCGPHPPRSSNHHEQSC